MDEQNRVEDIDRVDGGSTSEQKKAMMAENSQAQNGQGVQSVQAPYSLSLIHISEPTRRS